MKIQNPLFFHFCEFFGKGAPFHIQIISYLLAVKGDRKIFALVFFGILRINRSSLLHGCLWRSYRKCGWIMRDFYWWRA